MRVVAAFCNAPVLFELFVPNPFSHSIKLLFILPLIRPMLTATCAVWGTIYQMHLLYLRNAYECFFVLVRVCSLLLLFYAFRTTISVRHLEKLDYTKFCTPKHLYYISP